MSEKIIKSSEFVEACNNATIKALKGKVKEEDIHLLLKSKKDDIASSSERDALVGGTGAGAAEAKGETYTILVYGYIKCTPTHLPYEFEANHWGLGLAGLASYGSMYTAFSNWDAFFRETEGYHAQGVADAGGIFQITWFDRKGVPIGQFNSVAGGIGIFEVGGKGKWKKK